MSVPISIRDVLRQILWEQADVLGWIMLRPSDKSHWYGRWTRDPNIGGRLGRYMDQGKIRVYIKDSLLKDYTRSHLAESERPFRVLNVKDSLHVEKMYTKPHGRLLADGRVICWGQADDWKTILMALHERTFGKSHVYPYAAVFLFSTGRYHESSTREMVQDAADKLNVKRVVWLD